MGLLRHDEKRSRIEESSGNGTRTPGGVLGKCYGTRVKRGLQSEPGTRRPGCGFSYQTEDNEALRDDENFSHVAVWEFAQAEKEPVLHKEELGFQNVELTQRSYK